MSANTCTNGRLVGEASPYLRKGTAPMSLVKYTGNRTRTIRSYEWAAMGFHNVESVNWNKQNDFAVPSGRFTEEQLAFLEDQPDFQIVQEASTPAAVAGGGGSRSMFLEGVPLWTYGSSFTVQPPFAASAGMRFDSLVASRLRMLSATTFGAAGKSIRDAAKRVVGGLGVADAAWTPARRGIGVIDTWVNDLAAYGAGNVPRAFVAKDISGIKGNLAAALTMMSAQTLYDNTVGVKAGTWAADGAGTDRSGGNNSVSTTPGATMTFENVDVTEDHFFYLAHTLEPNTYTPAKVEVLWPICLSSRRRTTRHWRCSPTRSSCPPLSTRLSTT